MLEARNRRLVAETKQDAVIAEREKLAGQMLRELGGEDQTEPALATAAGDALNLIEDRGHLLDSLGGHKLMRLLDNDDSLWLVVRWCLVIKLLLSFRHAAQQIRDCEI